MREIRQLQTSLDRRAPAGQYQYVDMVFELADTDTPIPHQLRASPYADIMYEVVKASAACVVYEDMSPTRQDWNESFIYLRCDTAGTTVRLLLTTRG